MIILLVLISVGMLVIGVAMARHERKLFDKSSRDLDTSS